MEEKKFVHVGQGPVREIEFSCENGAVSDESVIIYRSWFECLKEQGPKRFAQAMAALLSFAFYDESVKTANLPRSLEAILETFTPVIETNRRRRIGGRKGADFGKNGGRVSRNADSKTPKGLNSETPMVINNGTPMASPCNVNVNGNVNDTVSVNVNDRGASSPHTNFEFYIPVFFFRNARYPEKQAKKFVEHYAPSNWRLQGGELMATDEQRIALAQRWDIRDDCCDRFKQEDLEMWRKLFKIAPPEIRNLMVSSSVHFVRNSEEALIVGPEAVYDWIENNAENTRPIILPWKAQRKYDFLPKE